MKSIAASVGLTFFCIGSAFAAPPTISSPSGGLKVTPKIPPVAVLRPDYAVKSIEQTVANGKVISLTITIVDLCNVKKTASPYVNVFATATLGYNAPFVNGASESVMTLALGQSTPAGSKIRVAVNEDKAVPEAWGGNNFLEKNPDVAPFPPGKNYCLPQNYEN